MKILIYSENQDNESWLKDTFQKQELTFTKTASELISEANGKDLIIVDYQTKLEDTLWELCEAGVNGKLVLLAGSNLPKTQKVAKSLNWNVGDVQAIRTGSLHGYSAKKIAKVLGVEYSESIKKEAQIEKGLKKNIDRQRKEFQSIYDLLLENLPDFIQVNQRDLIDDKSADRLYEIWKKEGNKVKDDTFRKPIEIRSEEVAEMERSGLVKMDNDKIKITAKGKEVLNVMILGDERSIFEHDGSNPLYRTALSNTDVGARLKKQGRK